jgi:hypothetical protein
LSVTSGNSSCSSDPVPYLAQSKSWYAESVEDGNKNNK